METFLTVLSGIGWIIVYEECIRLGFKEKTYAMPLFALGLNLAWEAIYSFSDIFLAAHGPLEGLNLIQAYFNASWVILDIIILFTYFKYGKNEFPKSINQKYFPAWTMLVIICCFALQYVFIKEFGFIMGAKYSAFLQNLLMSVMFIDMYIKRGNMNGQSLVLAYAKWIGTLAPTILFGILEYNTLVLVCGIFCSVFDIIYISLLSKSKKLSDKFIPILAMNKNG
ncbi:transmembrane-type terpene cyclase [Romboutsia sp. 1001713B170207_170306_H8]|uniref:transmembrane-type terpene cyclase n=1 Tax=Romboutsia sp. 1001713B170207_170306_H8 TaxID=2787112 RepID=UPI001897D330|nr:hypothetical protein [Romboutsia sp. 1001713B170207_170306_H8]